MNKHPKKGFPPFLPTFNATSQLFKKLLDQRWLQGGPILVESEIQHNLTIGQVILLKREEITLIMKDDLGKYELVQGDELDVIKRRI
jgi:hypothetical protein